MISKLASNAVGHPGQSESGEECSIARWLKLGLIDTARREINDAEEYVSTGTVLLSKVTELDCTRLPVDV